MIDPFEISQLRSGRIAIVGLLLALVLGARARADEPAAGKLVARVHTADGSGSYACYLPRAYRAGEKWPVLFAFSPDGQGARLAAHFRAAAERAGWVVVASNDSRNGELRGGAIESMFNDARRRLALDETLIYVAGFSGGARVATWFGGAKHAVGHVAIGGLHFPGDRNTPPQQRAPLPPMAYALLCGASDFNRQELTDATDTLSAAKQDVKLMIFPGGHAMPPPQTTAAAVAWLAGLKKPPPR